MNTLELYNDICMGCSQNVTSGYSTSFSMAIKLLGEDIQAPIRGIYGFVRLADEIVDTFHDFDKADLLRRFEEETYRAIEEKISLNPILQSFQLVVNKYGIELDLVQAFFKSMYADLYKKNWMDEQELNEYIYGSAEVVGLMCLQVFCDGDKNLAAELKAPATSLGAAFQKVNFLRDLQDDMKNLNRQYFPGIDFNHFSPSSKNSLEENILKDFEDAFKGIVKLPVSSRFGVLVAYRYYLCLFNKIRQLPPEAILKRRVRVHNFQKMVLLLKTAVAGKWQMEV